MEIPESIKIGAVNIPIKFVRPLDLSSMTTLGEYNTHQGCIKISEDLPEGMLAQTLMHEIGEAVANNSCLNINHEHLSVLCNGIFEAIRTNGLDFRELPHMSQEEIFEHNIGGGSYKIDTNGSASFISGKADE